MKKKNLGAILFLISLILSACQQGGSEQSVFEVLNPTETIRSSPPEEPTASSNPENNVVEAPDADEFVPITVEDFGISTVVPQDWPPIEGDPLLKNAWGPGEFRFIAFHTVPGSNVRPSMAQLLGIDVEGLLQNLPEGEYLEEQIGNYEWALYNVDNPEIGLSQSVAMTVQDGTVYIVSLFVEMEYQEAVLYAALENFAIGDSPQEGNLDAAAVSSDLQTTDWVLKMLVDGAGDERAVLSGTELTIEFKSGQRISGSAGCNDFASNYIVDGSTLTITAPAKTRQNCDQPQGIMLQETQYFNNLTAVSAYQIEEDRLRLLDEQGEVILVFGAR